MDADTTNEEEYSQHKQQVEINSMLVPGLGNSMNSMLAIRKPFSSITLRSHDGLSLAQSQLKPAASERVSDDMEITDLSNSENNPDDEVKSKVSSSRLAHVMVRQLDDGHLDKK